MTMGDFELHCFKAYKPQPSGIKCIAENKENRKLAVGRSDNSIEVWNHKGNLFLERIIPGKKTRIVEAVCFVKSRLFSTGFHGDLTEYDLLTLQPMESVIVSASGCGCMTSNSSQTHLIIGSEDGSIYLYSVEYGKAQYEKMIGKIDRPAICMALHRDDDMLVVGSQGYFTIFGMKKYSQLHQIKLGEMDRKMGKIICWSIAISSDYCIVTGDSNREVNVWDGKNGTHISTSKQTRGDVLSLCFSEDENTVYASGVDPVVYAYSRTNDQGSWIKTSEIHQSQNDVRAMCLMQNAVVVGGVDGYLRFIKSSRKMNIMFSPLTQYNAFRIAEKEQIALLQYADKLELYKLSSNDDMPSVCCLLILHAKENDVITRSDISEDGKWLAYSTTDRLKIFSLTEAEDQSEIQPTKIADVPKECQLTSCFQFTPDCSKLVVASPDGNMHILKLSDGNVAVHATITPEESEFQDRINLMAVSGDSKTFAAADLEGRVHIFKTTGKLFHKMPKRKFPATALRFNPTSKELCVAYSDMVVHEFDLKERTYTQFTRKVEKLLPLTTGHPLTWISYDPSRPELVILKAGDDLFIVNKTEALNGKVAKKWLGPGVHIYDRKAEHLVFGGSIGKGTLLTVEVTANDLLLQLSPVLEMKVFGGS